ncbi:MAG TPA: transcriptional repressor [Planctomycetaceae bacterium]|jgi:Fur family ferric uptake transcriptional regulator|nr:transcriptional repressor [Planctomycetaceae bacterium]
MTSTKGSAQREALRARIQEFGLRCTAARLAVVGELHRAASPLSHAEIALALAPLDLDRATVYRSLMELSESGLVSRLDLGDHVWRFELREKGHGEAAEHPHFLCTECGEVSCLNGVEIKVTPGPRNKPSAVGKVTEILLKGRCARCS